MSASQTDRLFVVLFWPPSVRWGPASAREQIRIVGFVHRLPLRDQRRRALRAHQLVTRRRSSRAPDRAAAFKLFCAGVGDRDPDVANSSGGSNPPRSSSARRSGVTEIVEIKLGYDGIVLANAKGRERFSLTTTQIFLALAREIPVAGKLVENPNRTWKDVDPSLPDLGRSRCSGPPPTSGTRDAFVELAMEKGARQIPMLAELKKTDKKAFKAVAHAIREDGAYVEAGENDNLIVRKLEANPFCPRHLRLLVPRPERGSHPGQPDRRRHFPSSRRSPRATTRSRDRSTSTSRRPTSSEGARACWTTSASSPASARRVRRATWSTRA